MSIATTEATRHSRSVKTGIDGDEDNEEGWSSESIDRESAIYDLPDVSSVSKGVLCKLFVASAIALIFLIIEVIGGILSGSLAILSDAAHMFSDLSGFFISIMSIWISTRPASKKLSYGYHRAEVIGALGSIVLIWGLTIVLLYEATNRIMNKSRVNDPFFMLLTAIFGLVCNIGMAKVLHSAPGHSHAGHDHGHGHSHDDHGHGDHHHDEEMKPKDKKGGAAASKCSGHKHSHEGHAHKEDHKHDHKHGHKDHKHPHKHDHGKENKGGAAAAGAVAVHHKKKKNLSHT